MGYAETSAFMDFKSLIKDCRTYSQLGIEKGQVRLIKPEKYPKKTCRIDEKREPANQI